MDWKVIILILGIAGLLGLGALSAIVTFAVWRAEIITEAELGDELAGSNLRLRPKLHLTREIVDE